jgi:hypothetical protein
MVPFFHALHQPYEYLFNNFSIPGVNYTNTFAYFRPKYPANEEQGH